MGAPDPFTRACIALLEHRPDSFDDLAAKAQAYVNATWINVRHYQNEIGLTLKKMPKSSDNLKKAQKAYNNAAQLHNAYLTVALGVRALAAGHKSTPRWQSTMACIQNAGVWGRRIMDLCGMLNFWNAWISLQENPDLDQSKRAKAELNTITQQDAMAQWVTREFPNGLSLDITEFLIEQIKRLVAPLPDRMYEIAKSMLNNLTENFTVSSPPLEEADRPN
jgi:hypothetical protein